MTSHMDTNRIQIHTVKVCQRRPISGTASTQVFLRYKLLAAICSLPLIIPLGETAGQTPGQTPGQTGVMGSPAERITTNSKNSSANVIFVYFLFYLSRFDCIQHTFFFNPPKTSKKNPSACRDRRICLDPPSLQSQHTHV